jgi:hypothetical protein
MQSLAQKIGVEHEHWMQDWPLEVADRGRVAEVIKHYEDEDNVDFRQLLAELVTASLDELFEVTLPSEEILGRASSILRSHDDILKYWSCEDAATSEDGFAITPWIRAIRDTKALTK